MIDATPFRQWYLKHYDVELNKKKIEESEKLKAETKRSRHVSAKLKKRGVNKVIDQKVAEQFNSGRLLACVSSRPGQSGRCDGYVLEGRELEFYQKKLIKTKKWAISSFVSYHLCSFLDLTNAIVVSLQHIYEYDLLK